MPRIRAIAAIRGITLIEIAVAIVVIALLALIAPRALSTIVSTAEKEVQRAAAQRLADSSLSQALAEDYDDLDEYTATQIGTATVTFREGTQVWTVNYGIERLVVEDDSAGEGKEFKTITTRVYWPEGQSADPVGEIVKVTIRSNDSD